MTDRKDVEALLEKMEGRSESAVIETPIPAPTLAALCRAWLALDSGQIETVREAKYLDGTRVGKLVATTGQSMIGQRVRIVPVEAREK